MTKEIVVPVHEVAQKIFLIRGHRVMLDRDLAEMYQVTTKALNQAVKRNIERFPSDFMFQISESELQSLRSQIVTSKEGSGGRRYLPYVFTEQGVAMLSTVLKSKRAILVNIFIMRAFVRIRELALSNKIILQKLDALERKYAKHDVEIEGIFDAIKGIMTEPKKPARRIGFRPPDSSGKTKARKRE